MRAEPLIERLKILDKRLMMEQSSKTQGLSYDLEGLFVRRNTL